MLKIKKAPRNEARGFFSWGLGCVLLHALIDRALCSLVLFEFVQDCTPREERAVFGLDSVIFCVCSDVSGI